MMISARAIAARAAHRAGFTVSATSSRWSGLLPRVSNRSFVSPTLSCGMPIKTIELVSLGKVTVEKGRLVEVTVPPGQYVQAGDIVAVVDTPYGDRIQVATPESGRLVAILHELLDSVRVGDALFSLDTDQTMPAAAETGSDEQAIVNHMQENGGLLGETFVNELIELEDTPRLRQLALLFRDRFPAHRSIGLRFLERVLTLQRDNSETPATTVAETFSDIGILQYRLGDLDAAMTALEQALILRKEALGPVAPETAATYIQIGAVLNQKGDFEGAFKAFSSALEIQQKTLGDEHPIVAASLNNLGAILYQKGDYKAAVDYYKRGLEMHKKLFGEDHSDTAGSYNNVSYIGTQM